MQRVFKWRGFTLNPGSPQIGYYVCTVSASTGRPLMKDPSAYRFPQLEHNPPGESVACRMGNKHLPVVLGLPICRRYLAAG